MAVMKYSAGATVGGRDAPSAFTFISPEGGREGEWNYQVGRIGFIRLTEDNCPRTDVRIQPMGNTPRQLDRRQRKISSKLLKMVPGLILE